MLNIEVNLIAVLIAGLVYMVLGAFWYSPSLFGKQWMGLVGKTEEDVKASNAVVGYVIAMSGALVASYVLAHMIQLLDARTIASGIQTGFWLWLGFVATTSATNYSFAGRPRQLYFIDQGYHLVALLLMGTILAVWG